jgi:hypothetical protein
MPEADPDLERYWNRLGHPAKNCSVCKAERNSDDSKITWRCEVCGRLVCRGCTLTVPRFVQRLSDGSFQEWAQGPSFVLAEDLDPDRKEGVAVISLRGGKEYLTSTLCSPDCWVIAGKPDE